MITRFLSLIFLVFSALSMHGQNAAVTAADHSDSEATFSVFANEHAVSISPYLAEKHADLPTVTGLTADSRLSDINVSIEEYNQYFVDVEAGLAAMVLSRSRLENLKSRMERVARKTSSDGVLNGNRSVLPISSDIVTSPEADENGNIRICQGETVAFTANVDYQGGGGSDATSMFSWTIIGLDFIEGEGTDFASIDYTFDDQNGYQVKLLVEDVNGDISTNVVTVLVSTTPSFAGVVAQFRDTICVTDTTRLIASIGEEGFNLGVTPIQGSIEIAGSFSDTLVMPDGGAAVTQEEIDAGVEVILYNTPIEFCSFEQGATLTSVDQIDSVCMTVEHSYIGDMEFWLTCPDGSEVLFINAYNDNAQGVEIWPGAVLPYLGGADLGEPGAGADNGVVGTGYTYCFAPSSPLGDFQQALDDGVLVTDGTVNPGTYMPDDTLGGFGNLVGCPLNGTWRLWAGDYFNFDDGYIFEWSITFSDDLQTDTAALTYRPILESGMWINIDDDPTVVFNNDTILDVHSTIPGDYSYTFSVTDDFECTYDTTVTVHVLEDYQVDIASDQACNFNTQVTVEGSYQGGSWSIEGQTEDFSGFVAPAFAEPVSSTSTASAQNSEVATITYFDSFCQTTKELTTFFRPFPIATISYNGDTLPTHPDWEPDEEETIIDMVEYDSLYLCVGDETVLTALGQPISITDANYYWEIGGADVVTLDENILPVDVDALIQAAAGNPNIEIMLSVEDDMCPGVFSTAVIPVVPEGCFPYNIVTPNGDGMNDNFVIGGATRLRNNYLLVFNRWGNKVYEQRAYKNDWSPTDLPDGTYFYVFTSDSKGGEFNGSFTISGSQN